MLLDIFLSPAQRHNKTATRKMKAFVWVVNACRCCNLRIYKNDSFVWLKVQPRDTYYIILEKQQILTFETRTEAGAVDFLVI